MKFNDSLKRKAADISEFPKDVVFREPVLTVTGTNDIHIENYANIIEYTESIIRIRIKTGQIIVKGKNLHVEYYNDNDMKIIGRIDTIKYQY